MRRRTTTCSSQLRGPWPSPSQRPSSRYRRWSPRAAVPATRTTLSLVAYSTPQEAYEEIIPAFQKTAAGKDVDFKQSYGASGDQARAVEAGLDADVVALSLAPDVDKLVEAGKVAKDWASDKYDGFVTNSVVVFAVRKGNPKNIKTWDDLVKDGVEVIEPNPFTSGGAKWNIMAAYGAQLEQGKSQQEALDYLKAAVQERPGPGQERARGAADVRRRQGRRAARLRERGDHGAAEGQDIDYVLPDETILIQNPIAVTTDAAPAAQDFVDFTRSEEAQKIYAEKGYRSVIPSLVDKSKYPTPAKLFEITKFGGWDKVNDEFFDPDKGSIAEIEQSLGVSTEK